MTKLCLGILVSFGASSNNKSKHAERNLGVFLFSKKQLKVKLCGSQAAQIYVYFKLFGLELPLSN